MLWHVSLPMLQSVESEIGGETDSDPGSIPVIGHVIVAAVIGSDELLNHWGGSASRNLKAKCLPGARFLD